MKKFLAGIAAAAIITVPMTSFALESLSKGALKKATGQAGVSIALDDVVIVQSMPTTIYWDTDGVVKATADYSDVTTDASKAGIAISYNEGANKMVIIDAIVDAVVYGADLMYDKFGVRAGVKTLNLSTGDDAADFGKNMKGFTTKIAPLTIDIGTCESLTAGNSYNRDLLAAATTATAAMPNGADGKVSAPAVTNRTIAGVVIGLPTVEISTYMSANERQKISVVTATTGASNNSAVDGMTTAGNYSSEIIAIQKVGVQKMAILGGRVEIASH